MKNNQKGFTYPLTLCLLIVFLLFLSKHIEQLLMEKKMAHETSVIQQEEYYFLTSVKKIEILYQKSGSIPATGKFTFVNGTMGYQADAPVGTVKKVTFNLILKNGLSVSGKGFFDIGTKKLIRWTEIR